MSLNKTIGSKLNSEDFKKFEKKARASGLTNSEYLRKIVIQSSSGVPSASSPPKQTDKEQQTGKNDIDTFNYETWKPQCEFATYIPEKKKVHCICKWKPIKEWLPSNRMVEPRRCEACYTGTGYGSYGSTKAFIERKQDENTGLRTDKEEKYLHRKAEEGKIWRDY